MPAPLLDPTAAVLEETIRLWQVEPDKARVKPVVTARSDGPQAVIDSGAYSWRCDASQPLGGTNAAPSPTALLLSALAGCAVVFIHDTLAPQLKVQLQAVQALAECEVDGRGLLGLPGAIPDFQNVRLTIHIESPDTEENVRRLYEVWRERCPIYLGLVKPLPVSTALEIRNV